MPGRDKPLITRNGIPDPQAYNPQTGQWESFIGVSWGKTAGGLYVPIRVDDQGRQEVTLSGNIVQLPLDPSFPATITAGARVLMFGSTSGGLWDFKAIRVGWVTFSSGCNIELDVGFYTRDRYNTTYRIAQHKKTLSGSGQIYMNELVEVISPYFTVHVTNKDTSDTYPAGRMIMGVR